MIYQDKRVKATCRHCGKRYWKLGWQRAAHCSKQKGVITPTGIYRDVVAVQEAK